MAVRPLPASQLFRTRDTGDHIHVEVGESPRKHFGLLWPLSYTLANKEQDVGDHILFDGRSWWVGFKAELLHHFNTNPPNAA